MDPHINNPSKTANWQNIITRYNRPDLRKSIWQIINSLVPYIVIWVMMILSLKISPWITLALAVPAAGFLIRLFIIFHDCGHGSFTRSKKWNRIIGIPMGILAFTPYDRWTDSHRIHHATVGNLDKRGVGDVWTLTVKEYLGKSRRGKLIYRIFRHPLVFLGFGGFLMFIITNRFTRKTMTPGQKSNIYVTNLALLIMAVGLSWLIGWKAYLFIQLSIMYFASIFGVYLFYLQHQYEEVIWKRDAEWDYQEMALHGSSFFKLPGLLRWFTGSIGFHHIHHLGPTIPNYNLVKCHRENELFQQVKPITFFESFRSLTIRLWDEDLQRVISFSEMKRIYFPM